MNRPFFCFGPLVRTSFSLSLSLSLSRFLFFSLAALLDAMCGPLLRAEAEHGWRRSPPVGTPMIMRWLAPCNCLCNCSSLFVRFFNLTSIALCGWQATFGPARVPIDNVCWRCGVVLVEHRRTWSGHVAWFLVVIGLDVRSDRDFDRYSTGDRATSHRPQQSVALSNADGGRHSHGSLSLWLLFLRAPRSIASFTIGTIFF